jgi:hypothetical protein
VGADHVFWNSVVVAPREPAGWEIAIAVNAAFKGLLGALGQSGHVCQRAIGVQHAIDASAGYQAVLDQISTAVAGDVATGDTVVIADKVVAIAQQRVGPAEILTEPDPKTVDEATRRDLAIRWSKVCGFPISPTQLLLADEYEGPDGSPLATLGCMDHNGAAFDLAHVIANDCGVNVDVVISDTDTGLDVRAPLIGTLTICATPLGATAGLRLYECMRCACAAEFVRGHDRGIPAVICRPARRCVRRPGLGEHRGYPGILDGFGEALTHA